MPYQKDRVKRDQVMMISLEDMVGDESVVRLVDRFCSRLDMEAMGFKGCASEGRPEYDPRLMLGLLIYGSRKGIRSSRKLEEACEVNVEAIWLMHGLTPDFRTISDFRKDNIKCLKKVFHEFNSRLAELYGNTVGQDGSKFGAGCSKENNVTRAKLNGRIERLDAESDKWLKLVDEMDAAEDGAAVKGPYTREELEALIADAKERKAAYEAILADMQERGVTQISYTDADSRLMRSKEGFMVAYNVQTLVDYDTHIIRDYAVTNRPTDHGLLFSVTEGIRNETDGVLNVVADNGYKMEGDMLACLMNREIPHVITPRGGDGCYTMEIAYEPAEDLHPESLEPAEIERCLRAGVVPEAYEGVLTAEVVTNRKRDDEPVADPMERLQSPYGTEEEMVERAREGYFVRDPEANEVYCPKATLFPKADKGKGVTRYYNKLACRGCPYKEKCSKTKNAWVEVDFSKDCLEKPIRGFHKDDPPKKGGGRNKGGKMKKVKFVRLVLRPDKGKTSKRFGVSECPFGTMKRAMGCTHFNLRGLEKTDGEFALFALGYNLERAKNILGFERLMELM
ncbi:MAG: transposase [Bacteroidales bacterium]|nr:transposase [Bacteroidales bacterium]MCD8207853.1 transposase [Bacteroidales bacterium]